MGIFKKISQALTGGPGADQDGYMVYVRCSRCGETIQTRVNLLHDLSLRYGEGEAGNTYFCRKVLIGSQRCFNRVEVELTFSSNRKLLEREITGGEFITAEDFEAAAA